MIKNLTQIGNSLGVIIDKPILELLNITKDTLLDVRTDGDGLIIRPVRAGTVVEEPSGEGTLDAASERDGRPDRADRADRADRPDKPRPRPIPTSPNDDTARSEVSRGNDDKRADDKRNKKREPGQGPPPMVAPGAMASGGENSGSEGSAVVVVELKGEVVQRVPMGGRSGLTIGRDPGCEIHLDDRALSRRHARVERRGAALWVLDLKSANGTMVNGVAVKEPRRLHGGDTIGVGRYVMKIDGVEQAKADTPVLTLTGPEGTHRFALVGEEITLGRAETCDIAIGHKSISRRHMKISIKDGGFTIEDLGSQNGTKVAGKRILGPTGVKAGEKIGMGGFVVELGFLESNSASTNRPRTMLIDKRELAKTAYVDGQYDNVHSAGGKLALGKQGRGGTKGTASSMVASDESKTMARES